MSEGLAEGPYMAVRVGYKPATLQTQCTELTTEPPRLQRYQLQTATYHSKIKNYDSEFTLSHQSHYDDGATEITALHYSFIT